MMPDDTGATPNGLQQCLGLLIDEAESMRLGRTSAALRDALMICREEAEIGRARVDSRPLGSALH